MAGTRPPRTLTIVAALGPLLIAAACGNQAQPAQEMIGDLESIMAATSADAVKYVPERYADIEAQVSDLESAYARKDYRSVMARAPAALAAVQALAADAAAKKAETLQARRREWSQLAEVLPERVIGISRRIEMLEHRGAGKRTPAVDTLAARKDLNAVTSLWSKAQAAFAAGNLDEALQAARQVAAELDPLAVSIGCLQPACPR
jgi:hypothetical protein